MESLRGDPARFEFVQALRLLQAAARAASRYAPQANANPVGFDHAPGSEVAQLRAAPDLAFPAAEVAGIATVEGQPEVSVSFMGLNGVSGLLPSYYTQLVLDSHREKNEAPRDFLDLFNHRALSFFLRASYKYRMSLAYEQSGEGELDPISSALLALVGLHGRSLRDRQAVVDEALLYYGGHFAHRPRTATSLGQLLSGHFDRPITILQFQGRWVSLPEHEQTSLAEHARYATLGATAVVGSRVWDVQGSFRIRLGPLDYAQFTSFMPNGEMMAALAALTRSYVGPALSFDVQLTLLSKEVPTLVLSSEATPGPRLGWNTWLNTETLQGEVSDAVFRVEAA